MYIEESIQKKVNHFLETMPKNMGHALDIEFKHLAKDKVQASMPVDENTMQPFGILHGGASVALAETTASIGAWLSVVDESKNAVGVEINANHLRPAKKGDTVTGTAVPIKRGRKIHIWEIKVQNEEGKIICISRCTLAIVDGSLVPDNQ